MENRLCNLFIIKKGLYDIYFNFENLNIELDSRNLNKYRNV